MKTHVRHDRSILYTCISHVVRHVPYYIRPIYN